MEFCAKDFIETADGLIFAVVQTGLEDGKVLCFLRYIYESLSWKKLSTEQANSFLQQQYPNYLHYSAILDTPIHAVSAHKIIKHHQPKLRLQQILQASHQHDAVELDVVKLFRLLSKYETNFEQTGITGSILIAAQNSGSDIDLVCYCRHTFHRYRSIIQELIDHGTLHALNTQDWLQTYQRRSCALSFNDYVRHEQRKFNKALINERKFDLSYVDCYEKFTPIHYRKCGAIILQCRVTDDSRAFHYPAEYEIENNEIAVIVCFTATYIGQAFNGEWIEVAGLLEQSEHGVKRIVVGSSREAQGEYIKVIEPL